MKATCSTISSKVGESSSSLLMTNKEEAITLDNLRRISSMVMGLWRMQMETSVRGHGNRMRALTKVSVKLNVDIEYFDVGVYVWANGIKAPVSFKDGKICFG